MELIRPFWFSATSGLIYLAGRRVSTLPPGVLPLDLGEFGNQALDTRPVTPTDLEDWGYDKETIEWVMDALADRRVHDAVRGVWFFEPGYERNTQISVPREGTEIWSLTANTEDECSIRTLRHLVVRDQRAMMVATTIETPAPDNQVTYYGPAERIVAIECEALVPIFWTALEDGSIALNLDAETIAQLGKTSSLGGEDNDAEGNGKADDAAGS